ncbi:hypothetical protein M1146_08140, partial [Patescibacteria group bacterium]|nr:hypothetical protein [Patescibacteria group bacterium]
HVFPFHPLENILAVFRGGQVGFSAVPTLGFAPTSNRFLTIAGESKFLTALCKSAFKAICLFLKV